MFRVSQYVLVLALFIALAGCKLDKVTGCCQAQRQVGADKCASGQGVTREYCEQELDGVFFENKECNTDTSQCE